MANGLAKYCADLERNSCGPGSPFLLMFAHGPNLFRSSFGIHVISASAVGFLDIIDIAEYPEADISPDISHVLADLPANRQKLGTLSASAIFKRLARLGSQVNKHHDSTIRCASHAQCCSGWAANLKRVQDVRLLIWNALAYTSLRKSP